MKWLRMSIAGLMAFVFLSAIGFAALRSGSMLWFSGLYTACIATLLGATMAARFCRRDAGTFWFGFALVGWMFLLVGLGIKPLPSEELGDEELDRMVSEYLLTTRLMKSLHAHVTVADDLSQVGKYGNSLVIGHVLLTFIVAFMGGLFAVALRRYLLKPRRNRTTSEIGASAPRTRTRIAALISVSCGLVFLVVFGVLALDERPRGPYFPALTGDPAMSFDPDEVASYEKHLSAMHEPSLWKLSQADRAALAYRLLWIPDSHPVSVRVTRTGEAIVLEATALDGSGDEDPGSVVVRRTLSLDRKQWEKLVGAEETSGFWSLPAQDENTATVISDTLLIEAIKDGHYHAVSRPKGVSAPFDAFGRALLDASGLIYTGFQASGFR